MLRKIQSTIENLKNIENITKNVLDEIVKAGSIHFGGKLSLLGPIVNLDIVTKHFSEALKTVFENKAFFINGYKKLSDTEKARFCNMLAQPFIKKYGDSKNCMYKLLYTKYRYHKYFEGIYLLGGIFGVRVQPSDKHIKMTLIREITTALDFIHKNQTMTLVKEYANKNSFFSSLPKELISHIENDMNAIHFHSKRK